MLFWQLRLWHPWLYLKASGQCPPPVMLSDCVLKVVCDQAWTLDLNHKDIENIYFVDS